MKYSFIGKIFRDGNRNYIKIPFNVWETCGQKGMILVKADIESDESSARPRVFNSYARPYNGLRRPSFTGGSCWLTTGSAP